MKKLHKLLLYSLVSGLTYPTLAQDHPVQSDSINAVGSISVSKADTTLSLRKSKPLLNDLVGRRIAVRAGDSISVSALVLDNTRHKGRFWKNVAKAIISSFIVSNLSNGKNVSSDGLSYSKGNATALGAGLTVVPGAIELTENQLTTKTFVSLAVFDADSQRIAVVSDFMTKAARKDWQQLRVGYRIEKDGFVEIIGSRNQSNGLAAEVYGRDNWLKVTKYTNKQSVDDARPGNTAHARSGVDSPADVPVTQGGPVQCIAWYWCNSAGCTFIGIECQLDLGENTGQGGGSGGEGGPSSETPDQKCAKCKELAQREHDKNLVAANAALTAAVVGCQVGAFQTGVQLNAVGSWLHLIPGIGTATVEILAVLGAITVDITCLTTAVLSYNAVTATIENNYFKDMNDCEQLCH